MLSVGYVEHDLNDQFSRGAEMNYWTLEFFSVGQIEMSNHHGKETYISPIVALIPPRLAYAERAIGDGQWKEHYVIFDPPSQWNHLLSWPENDFGIGVLYLPNIIAVNEVESSLKTALEFQLSARVNRLLLVRNAFEKLLLILDEINPSRGNAQRDERIENTVKFIATYYAQPLDLETLARCAFLSPSRFSHLFKQQTKQSPLQFLENYRLERAAEKLLQSSHSIEHIAYEVGFNNAFHFSTRFRKRFGQSPSHYRRNPS